MFGFNTPKLRNYLSTPTRWADQNDAIRRATEQTMFGLKIIQAILGLQMPDLWMNLHPNELP